MSHFRDILKLFVMFLFKIVLNETTQNYQTSHLKGL